MWIAQLGHADRKLLASIIFLPRIELALESFHILISNFDQIDLSAVFAFLSSALTDSFASDSPEILTDKGSFQIMLF